jgi:drug/metabolite transporter (DMT)-like permease
MVTYLFPLGGVVLGVVFLNEDLSWQLVIGAVLIVLSLVVANAQSHKQEKSVKQIATD